MKTLTFTYTDTESGITRSAVISSKDVKGQDKEAEKLVFDLLDFAESEMEKDKPTTGKE